jgi:hypothetical protein
MRTTYGIVWREGEEPVSSGKLELLPLALRIEGRAGRYDLPYAEVAAVRVGRSRDDRLGGRRSLVVERRTGKPLTIATVGQAGLVAEIFEHLAQLQLAEDDRDDRELSFLATPGAGDSDGGDVY